MSPKLPVAIAVIFSVIFVQSAFAQKTDLAAVKCADFIKTSDPAAASMITWLQGYYTYEDDQAVLDNDKVKLKESQVKEYCADHGDTDLVSASAIFMDKKYNTTTANSSPDNHPKQ
jgi:hypothetical protein